jgi:PadR family transcriptional regulator PadR
MSPSPGAVLPGTLELLILRSLSTGELHGLGVARRIAQMTHETVDVKAGSLFPALHRMERSGWVKSAWDESENRRRARFYRLTAKGRQRLETETEQWRRIVAGLANALEMP